MDLRDQARILDIKEGLDKGKFKLFCQVDDSGKNSSYVVVDPNISTKGKGFTCHGLSLWCSSAHIFRWCRRC